MSATPQPSEGRTPNSQIAAGAKRPATEYPLETSRDGKGKRFKGCSSIRKYTMMSKLGEGTFGEVFKAESREDGEIVALKKIIMHQEKDGFPVTALREIKLLKMLSHPNVLKLEEMVMERDRTSGRKKATMYMVTPYMDHDLSGLLENPAVKFSTSHLKCYMMQLLKGIAYLHASQILHRDIKAANLLINNEGILQIADFGLARPYDDPPPQPGQGNGRATRGYTGVVVTRWYRPPEVLMQLRNYTPAIDIWGVGCVCAEMFERRPILNGPSDIEQLRLIFELMGSPTDQTMPGWRGLPGLEGMESFKPMKGNLSSRFREQGDLFISLLSQLMMLDWTKRINAIDALKHPYFETEPLPANREDIPHFQESHELDRRKFRELAEERPPAPAGGAVGMGPEGEYVNGNNYRGGSRQSYHRDEGTGARNGYDARPRQHSYGSRVAPPPPPGAGPPAHRERAWERSSNGLPPRPPVDIPKGGPGFRGGDRPPRERDSYRDRDAADKNRGRLPRDGRSDTDTYIPNYGGRDDGPRDRDDRRWMDDRRDRYDDRDGARRRSRSPPHRDRDREPYRERDSYRR